MDRLKKYLEESATIPENYLDGCHTSSFVPNFQEQLEFLYCELIESYNVPKDAGFRARELLKPKVNLAYKMADWLGDKGIKQLDHVLTSFATWVNN